MALDTSAARVALGQLQALPFRNIIGGPLTAAIEAQALAAKTTVDFIKAIGFETIDGQLHAVNLAFSYEDATGYFRRVTVPLLSVIPIPFIVIETVDIQFKARISASAEQASSNSSETTEAVSGTAKFRFWGQQVDISASYSAKKDSKGSQESKYSVEYTLDVQVHATQAGIPQGMAQILNILQDGISNQPKATQITVYGLSPLLVGANSNATFSDTDFNVLVLDMNGEPITGATVVLTSANGLIKQGAATSTGGGVYTIPLLPMGPVATLTADAIETLQIKVTTPSTAIPPSEVTNVARNVTVRKGA